MGRAPLPARAEGRAEGGACGRASSRRRTPVASAGVLRFRVDRRGLGIGPEALRRLLKRLDDERIRGTLALQGIQKAPPEDLRKKETLRAQWELRLAAVPSDWSDIYAQVRLDSTDYLERGALLLAPINPSQYGGPAALRFRSAHHFGYGVSPGDGRTVLRALRRRGDHRRRRDPLRAFGYTSRGDARSSLAARRAHRVSEGDPVSWFMIEPGWKVVDAQGRRGRLGRRGSRRLERRHLQRPLHLDQPPRQASLRPLRAGGHDHEWPDPADAHEGSGRAPRRIRAAGDERGDPSRRAPARCGGRRPQSRRLRVRTRKNSTSCRGSRTRCDGHCAVRN